MKYYKHGSARKSRKHIRPRLFIIAGAAVMVAALSVSAALLLGSRECARIIDFGTVLEGVSVNGEDISGMTDEEARRATLGLEQKMLGAAVIKLDVDGKIYEFTADELGVGTDYEDVIKKALRFGRTGTFEERNKDAGAGGASFSVRLVADSEKLRGKLLEQKTMMDRAPRDAQAIFMPWGYTADKKEYKPELEQIKAMTEAYARVKDYETPSLVRTAKEDMPGALRYQYWKKDEYIKDYTPADADISRFQYAPEEKGVSANVLAVADDIAEQIESGDFKVITVPVEIIEAAVKTEDVKRNTSLICSWTSSYASHSNYNRDYNVVMMSSLINGSVIEPGGEWSANDTAGGRTAATAKIYGWKKAPGLENGGTTDQYGGGVCQLGSTTYNAAIRAGLKITQNWHHTIPSDYIPLGLDATLNTGTKDLKIKNESEHAYYLVSYVNAREKNVTVEFYGPPLTDPGHPEWGNVIYDFEYDFLGYYGTPGQEAIFGATVALDGTVLSEINPVYVFAKPRQGQKVRVYKHVYTPEGEKLGEPAEFDYHAYPVINQVTYYFWPEPGTPPVPEPEPVPAPVDPAAVSPDATQPGA